MKTATIRDLRTRFPKLRRMLEREGEVVVTDRGRPVILEATRFVSYDERRATLAKSVGLRALAR